jgi:hypothetical protein
MRESQRVQHDQNEIRLLTHQSQAGALIGKFQQSCCIFINRHVLCSGKGGERVRQMRVKHSIGIKMFVQPLPFSTERVLALRGRAEDIERCLEEIFDILKQNPVRGQIISYDPYHFETNHSSEYGKEYIEERMFTFCVV